MKKEEIKIDEKKRSCSKMLMILMVVCVLLSLATLGIVAYDKYIRSDDLEHPILKPISGNKEDAKDKSNNDITYVNNLSNFAITDVNQSVKLGNREYKVKTGSQDKEDYVLFINDKVISKDNNFVHADQVFVTDKYALFTSAGQYGLSIVYAIDNEGNELTIKNDNQIQMNSLKIVSGILHATGNKVCFENCEPEHDIMVLYFGNSLIITFAN